MANEEKVKLQAPPDVSSVSFDGAEYAAVEGVVEVPVSAVAALRDHGFTEWVEMRNPRGRPRVNPLPASSDPTAAAS